MKTYIRNINQYLLERYPTIWNTKIVWILAISLIIHIIFFLFGLVTLTNPELLHDRGAKDIFFDNGSIFLSVILSILILVFWVINMFKNNAFKNFYPVSRFKLFSQFIHFFVIIFCSTTFYYSYNLGLKTYISGNYSDARFTKETTIANKAAIFLSHDIQDYTVNKRKYPTNIFSPLYCENRGDFVDIEAPHFTFLDFDYQFYTLKTKTQSSEEVYEPMLLAGYIYKKTNDTIVTYFYKDSVINISEHFKTSQPSYYNYSDVFFGTDEYDNTDLKEFNYDSNLYYEDYQDINKTEAQLQINKTAHLLLDRNNTEELKQLLADFLEISDIYKVKHNLTAEKWFKEIYHPENFEVSSLIEQDYRVYSRVEHSEQSELQKYNNSHFTDYYISSDNLKNAFENINEIKNTPIISHEINIFLWLSFIIALILFCFRITGLKPLLFTIITTGVLSIFISLLGVLFSFAVGGSGNSVAFLLSYFTFILATTILLIPLKFSKTIKKSIVAICVNLSILGFVPYLLLIIGIISLHQQAYCDDIYNITNTYKDCSTLFDSFGIYLSYILFVLGFVFLYFYTAIIKKWKALAEG
ncbi:hypothetical protein [Lacinutrix undariae]